MAQFPRDPNREIYPGSIADQPDSVPAPPDVKPWTQSPACEKCGHALGAGDPAAAQRALRRGDYAQEVIYCHGSRDSTMKLPAMNSDTMTPGLVNAPVACFGIFEEHLHVRCVRCKFCWLMACKEK